MREETLTIRWSPRGDGVMKEQPYQEETASTSRRRDPNLTVISRGWAEKNPKPLRWVPFMCAVDSVPWRNWSFKQQWDNSLICTRKLGLIRGRCCFWELMSLWFKFHCLSHPDRKPLICIYILDIDTIHKEHPIRCLMLLNKYLTNQSQHDSIYAFSLVDMVKTTCWTSN